MIAKKVANPRPRWTREENAGSREAIIPTHQLGPRNRRAELRWRLNLADGHIRSGELNIAKQIERISRLEECGRDTRLAVNVLKNFRNVQATLISSREQLLEALIALN
jgi:hypothetical protein